MAVINVLIGQTSTIVEWVGDPQEEAQAPQTPVPKRAIRLLALVPCSCSATGQALVYIRGDLKAPLSCEVPAKAYDKPKKGWVAVLEESGKRRLIRSASAAEAGIIARATGQVLRSVQESAQSKRMALYLDRPYPPSTKAAIKESDL